MSESEYRARIKAESFRGTVTGKYLDPERRQQPTAIINGWAHYPINNYDMYQRIDTNDYILKDTGTFKCFLIKNGDTSAFYFSYAGKEIKE